MRKRLLFIAMLLPFFVMAQKNPNLAKTPPMGWNSYNKFSCEINEQMIREMADVMVSSGMKDAGYQYINLDIGWQALTRDANGDLQCDADKFPSGMKALADYIHSKGLKFGMYTSAGPLNCNCKKSKDLYPGSFDNEERDILKLASWGIDYIKVDACRTPSGFIDMAVARYSRFRDAIAKSGREIVLSICAAGPNVPRPWLWAPEVGQLWRTGNDIGSYWYTPPHPKGSWVETGIEEIIDNNAELRQYAGVGRWNDPDMMQVGNGKLTPAENRSHFSIWAMLSAPLLTGNDLRQMPANVKEIITNKRVIAVDQDALGVQALRYKTIDSIDVWVKPLENNRWAVCFLNRAKMTKQLNFNWKKHIVNDDFSKKTLDATKKTYRLINLWTAGDEGTTAKVLSRKILSHDVLMLTLE